MDPTLELCLLRRGGSGSPEPSFPRPYLPAEQDLHFLERNAEALGGLSVSVLRKEETEEVEYSDRDGSRELLSLRKRTEGRNKELTDARDKPHVNPFGRLPKVYTTNRAAMKLANINGVFPVLADYVINPMTKRYTNPGRARTGTGVEEAFSSEGVHFMDLGGAPGGFTEFIQKRISNSVGVGFSLKQGIAWSKDLSENDEFQIESGRDGTGDILTNYDFLAERYAMSKDVVVSDIGFSIPDFSRKESHMFKFVAMEGFVAVSVLRRGGNFVCKTMDISSRGSALLFWLLSLCFEKTWLFKPIASRPTNEEKYLVAMGRNDRERPVRVLKVLCDSIREKESELRGDFSEALVLRPGLESLPRSFESWLRSVNTEHLKSETEHMRRLLQEMDGKGRRFGEVCNVQTALTLWNVRDQPDEGF